MATQLVRVGLGLKDFDGNRTNTTVHASLNGTTATGDSLAALVTGLAAAMQPVIGGLITHGEVSILVPIAAAGGHPAADAAAYEVGVADFSLSGTTAHSAFNIPTVLPTKRNKNNLKDADTDVAALYAYLLAQPFSSREGSAFTAFAYSLFSSRKHRRVA